MAIIYSYPTVTPESGDLIVGTDITGKVTKNFTVGSIIDLAENPDNVNGTVNTIPVFTDAKAIGDSLIKQVTFDGSKTAVNVGTIPTKGGGTATDPYWIDNFQVEGTISSSGNITIGTPRELENQGFDLNVLGEEGKIAFGDNNIFGDSAVGTPITWNVVVGEYGTGDTDVLQLHGKTGVVFTRGALGSTVSMSIDSSGKVGIGTSTPSSELDVSGNITASKLISSANNSMFVEPSATSYFNHLRVDSILGSTFSPGVYGWQFEYDTPHASGVTFRFDNDHYRIVSGATGEMVRFTDTGNVGIGTTNPQFKLDIGSSMRIQGSNNLYFGGTASVPEWSINGNLSDLIINDAGSTQGAVLFQNVKGIVPRNATTAEINAISSPDTGAMVYNTTLNTICFYNGSAWRQVSHTAM